MRWPPTTADYGGLSPTLFWAIIAFAALWIFGMIISGGENR